MAADGLRRSVLGPLRMCMRSLLKVVVELDELMRDVKED